MLRYLAITATAASFTAAYVGYCVGRAAVGGAGPAATSMLAGAAGAFILAVLLAGPAAVVIAAVLARKAGVWARRIARSECAACGYSAGSLTTCPECGARPGAIAAPRRSVAAALVVLYAAGAVLGIAAGEMRMLVEEQRFAAAAARHCAATGAPCFGRLRGWPAGGSGMYYDAATCRLTITD